MTNATMEQKKNGGLLKGMIIGGAVGAVSALLLAPKSGIKLREDISTKYRSLNDKTQDIAKSVSDHTASLLDKAKETKQQVLDSWNSTKEKIKDE